MNNEEPKSSPAPTVAKTQRKSKPAETSLFVAEAIAEILLSYISKPAGTEGCWLWFGPIRGNKIPFLSINRSRIDAARITWVLYHQTELLGHYQLQRHCSSAFCVSPEHHTSMEAEDKRKNLSKNTQVTLTPHPSSKKVRKLLVSKEHMADQERSRDDQYTRSETVEELENLARATIRKLSKVAVDLSEAERQRAHKLSEMSALVISVQRSQEILSGRFEQLDRQITSGMEKGMEELRVITSTELDKLREAARACRNEANKIPITQLPDELSTISQSIRELQSSIAALSAEVAELKESYELPPPPSPEPAPPPDLMIQPELPPPEPSLLELFSGHVGEDLDLSPNEERDLLSALTLLNRDKTLLESKLAAFANHTAGQTRAKRSPASFFQSLIRQEI
jgi:hypothetical protein